MAPLSLSLSPLYRVKTNGGTEGDLSNPRTHLRLVLLSYASLLLLEADETILKNGQKIRISPRGCGIVRKRTKETSMTSSFQKKKKNEIITYGNLSSFVHSFYLEFHFARFAYPEATEQTLRFKSSTLRNREKSSRPREIKEKKKEKKKEEISPATEQSKIVNHDWSSRLAK